MRSDILCLDWVRCAVRGVLFLCGKSVGDGLGLSLLEADHMRVPGIRLCLPIEYHNICSS